MFYSYGMSICMRYGGSRDEAVEILNEGFMKIFTNLKNFEFSKPFKPWFRKILINCAINAYKARRRYQPEEDLDALKEMKTQEQISSGIYYQEIIELSQKLPPSYRAVFNLHVVEGYTHEEISELLGITPGTSKSNLFKAKQHLKILLKDFFEQDYVRSK
ncbi:MAG: RNA polymerase sigma factor [Cyclobacteriaceae bacterium]|nr:RNA polymerase sigma factor [Cyclobacteriaceae bacterium]